MLDGQGQQSPNQDDLMLLVEILELPDLMDSVSNLATEVAKGYGTFRVYKKLTDSLTNFEGTYAPLTINQKNAIDNFLECLAKKLNISKTDKDLPQARPC